MFFEPNLENVFNFEKFITLVDAEEDANRDTRDVCRLHLKGDCHKGRLCEDKHVRQEKAIVCEYWLRGICKKADKCEFLHEFDIRRMPECFYYALRGECLNPECVFVHVNPEDDVKDCPYYKRGFCSMGPLCKYRHRPSVLCPNYMAGFCLEGKLCLNSHPKFNHPAEDELADDPLGYIPLAQRKGRRDFDDDDLGQKRRYISDEALANVLCFRCGEKGHYANHCMNERKKTDIGENYQRYGGGNVTCFYCGQQGHKISECPTKPAGYRY
eukprot:NODE_3231_length_1020_cov_20.491246_g2972_i0.p1 GENE.NODE_3231_length_1020_cov_20.491246_g2972_i0~~NODE_3231_length_1020_cov_20.491246_g2972_i0.p1  ORF type:complete len:270 (-),score=40.47 NODE_3231_length_1020_cov_20.491246_g2972_i0:124-933(-)